MTIREIAEAVLESQLLGRIVVIVAMAVVIDSARRALKILNRIPSEKWFEDVGDALKILAAYKTTLDTNSGAITALEERVEDHEGRLSSLEGAHEALHGTHRVPV